MFSLDLKEDREDESLSSVGREFQTTRSRGKVCVCVGGGGGRGDVNVRSSGIVG